MTEGVVFYFVHPPGDGRPPHTACRDNIPNSTQNERYVCENNKHRTYISFTNACSMTKYASLCWLSLSHVFGKVSVFYLSLVQTELRMRTDRSFYQAQMTKKLRALLM